MGSVLTRTRGRATKRRQERLARQVLGILGDRLFKIAASRWASVCSAMNNGGLKADDGEPFRNVGNGGTLSILEMDNVLRQISPEERFELGDAIRQLDDALTLRQPALTA